MKAEILSIGSELLAGHITDTNATYLAIQLGDLGIQLQRVTQVGDCMPDLTDVLRSALGRSDLVVCTGGIGPTPDDLSREAVAEVLDETMTVQPELEARLRTFFRGRGYAMPEPNLKQATLIPSAQALHNRSGTAPGWWVDHDGKLIVLLPGVPVEMKTIWNEEVAPRLVGRSGASLVTETIKTFGLGESTVAEKLGDLTFSEMPTVATYAKRDGVHVTIRATGGDEAREAVHAAAERVRATLSECVWGVNTESLADVVLGLLDSRAITLATQEIASRGLLATLLLGARGSSYLGGAVATGSPPLADLTLTVGLPNNRTFRTVAVASCEVTVVCENRELARSTARASSPESLPERAAMTALDTLRRHLLGLSPA